MITEEQFIKNVKNKNKKADNIEIVGKYTGSDNPIDCECKIDSYKWSPIAWTLYRIGCPVCANKVIIRGINDLWTTHPHIAKLLTNPEDGYKMTHGSKERKSFTCPDCGEEVIQSVNNVVKRNHISCKSCNDNISTPNKIMYHLLSQLDIDFEPEKTFDWGINKNGNKVKYDFYVHNLSLIVEMHGIQHYERSFNENGRSVEEEQENDKLKKELALQNGVLNYISIDARISDYNYIKENILASGLQKIFDFSYVDWNKIFLNTSKSFVFEAAKLWNEGKRITDICDILKFEKTIIHEYLVKASHVNLCDYTPKKGRQRRLDLDSKKVVCIEDKVIYNSIEQAGRIAGVSANSIRNCCDLSKENLVSIKRKHYILYDDLMSMPMEQVISILRKPMISGAKPLFCIEENKIFNNYQEIKDWCGTCHKTINSHLNGKANYAGMHPTTGEKLHWRRVIDDDIISSYGLNNLKEKLMNYE